jgi:uncharacterized protein involved in response to NO
MTRQAHQTLFNLGFRPFFMGASVFAIASIGYWLRFNQGFFPLNLSSISPFQWHAHEMIFGYSLAVIVGFLFTAVKNWTGQQTPHGLPLIALFSLLQEYYGSIILTPFSLLLFLIFYLLRYQLWLLLNLL